MKIKLEINNGVVTYKNQIVDIDNAYIRDKKGLSYSQIVTIEKILKLLEDSPYLNSKFSIEYSTKDSIITVSADEEYPTDKILEIYYYLNGGINYDITR